MQPKSVEELTQVMVRLEANYRALLLATSAAGVVQVERVQEISDLILNSPQHADYPSAPLDVNRNPMRKRTPCFE
jgi:hypothetical protein